MEVTEKEAMLRRSFIARTSVNPPEQLAYLPIMNRHLNASVTERLWLFNVFDLYIHKTKCIEC